MDVHEKKLATAQELGATHVVDASKGDPVQAIREMTGGGVDYAFEAIGLKKAAEQSFECLRPGGTATVVGMIPVGQKIELEGSVFLREKKIQGCSMKTAFLRSARQEDVRCVARVLKAGRRSMYGTAECHGDASGLVAHHVLTYSKVEE